MADEPAGTPPAAAEVVEEVEEVEDPAAVLEANRKLNAENKSLRSRAKKAEEEAEAVRQAGLSAADKAVEDAKKAGYDEAEKFYRPKLAGQRVIARAAGDFHNPADVLMFIDLESLDVDDDHAIDVALTKLAEDRPYLVASKAANRPNIDQGPQGGGNNRPSATANDWLRKASGR